MRQIDADNLIKDVHEEWDIVQIWDETGSATACEIERLIDVQPTVDLWKYPSRGEMPNCTQRVLICYGQEEHIKIVWWRQDFHRFGDALPTEIIAWQYIVPPKEEA